MSDLFDIVREGGRYAIKEKQITKVLDSRVDKMPDSYASRLMVNKQDVLEDLVARTSDIMECGKNDRFHSNRYYSLLKELLVQFKEKLIRAILPDHLESYWRYAYEISYKGATLYLEHVSLVWLNKDTGEFVTDYVDQAYPLITSDTKMLTVEEYAKLYDVEQVTVRQWIRRGKLHEAEKRGKEWMISELSDVPVRMKFLGSSAYRWKKDLKDVPEGFEILRNYKSINIFPRMVPFDSETSAQYKYHASLHSSDAPEYKSEVIKLTERERFRLEMYLTENPDVLYTENTLTFHYKLKKSTNVPRDSIADVLEKGVYKMRRGARKKYYFGANRSINIHKTKG